MSRLNERAVEFLSSYENALANKFNVNNVNRYFNLTDPQETSLRDALLENAEFLQLITMADVDQLSGQVVSVGNPGIFTGRKKDGRFLRQTNVDGNTYQLVETDSGAGLPWDLLSVWANSGGENEFFQRMQDFILRSFSLDIINIGWNGQSVAENTDPVKNPNGEDVNKGWHQIAKEWNKGSQVLTDPITLDDNGDYRSLDAMASDLINTCIPPQFRNDPRLVVMVGPDLVSAEQYRLYQSADKPTEKIAAQMLGSTIAGRPAMIPPFMPGKRMVVTIPSNLHVYTQRGTRQRKVEFVEDRKQYENKYLRNEGYALEYPELYASIDESAVTIGKVTEPTEKVEG
ncbi:phage major capsid protein, P2 family [Proteus mirabilis]|uniref:phage major capsid protein, P2 family n=1 Tax=Proteus TaxID=583 RepID=UPI0013779115|nr:MULTISPECIES: phage major capsid protein, P2 family [Proteus]MCS6716463.1 phage major capsid protein, P2 family [Proteus mirabilis]MCS6720795.1 phage major capsid protein, P2 family [Proteus mirabilis]MCS6727901.1 phage major capsid protein, P2 family [Proteus mirabilis]MCS6736296.1 phage major capsid protein, P2 family [Proteus mirabilis]MCS6748542.1 phage major capsid protein, P2 family [Proteus mirabilis]